MSSDDELMNDIVDEASVDWIDLGHALAVVKLVEGGDDRMERFRRAAPLVVRLVRDGRLVPGEIGKKPGSFIPWPLTASQAGEHLEHYYAEVVSGVRPLQPWEPCLFAEATSESLPRGGRQAASDSPSSSP